MNNKHGTLLEEIFNAITHGLGLGLALFGTVAYFTLNKQPPTALKITGFVFFAIGMIFMYLMSILYHSLIFTRAQKVFLIFDYSAIFLFIAGTYTPFALTVLNGPLGWILLSIIWILAITGIVLKAVFFDRLEKVILGIYLAMGWLVIVAARPLWKATTPEMLGLIVAGGLSYTLGTIFYVWRKLPFAHTIWHVFVMVGSVCHYLAIFSL